MIFVALKPMNTAEGVRLPGDPVPEAADWPHLQAYFRQGYLATVEPADAEPFIRLDLNPPVPQPPAAAKPQKGKKAA